MALQHRVPMEQISRDLQRAPQLRTFLLHDVVPTGTLLGKGSYGEVVELRMAGLVCAGKKIYDTLISSENQGAQVMVDKYYKECRLLSELRHPHIVQFVGICFLPGSQLPVLVMERLQSSLDNLLETTPDIPLRTKLSILQDIAMGLVFLHNHSPAIIHRDLTARNVLLNAAMAAKITDLGNSRITNIRPGQLAQTMTKGIPGTLVYMPPEASTDHYGPPLDMFSFGHLSLFTAIQVFPGDLLPATYPNPHKNKVKARTELERRVNYIKTLESQMGSNDLVVFIKECFAFEPGKRPTAFRALERLERLRSAQTDPYQHMSRFVQWVKCFEKRSIAKLCLLWIEQKQILNPNSQSMIGMNLSLSTTYRLQMEKELEATSSNSTERVNSLELELVLSQDVYQAKEKMAKVKDQEIKLLKEELAKKENQLLAQETALLSMSYIQSQLDAALRKIESFEAEVIKSRCTSALKDASIQILMTELRGKDRIVQVKEEEQADVEEEKSKPKAKEMVQVMEQEITALREELVKKNKQLSAQESILFKTSHIKAQLDATLRKIQSLEAEMITSRCKLAMRDASIDALTTELRAKERILQEKERREPANVDKGRSQPEVQGDSKKWEVDRSQITLIRKLATGASSEVWEGQLNNETSVAIKILKPGIKSASEFLAQADTMKKINHQKVLQLYAISTHAVYIITELMKNGSLLEYLKHGEGRSLKLPQLIDMGAQISNGMAYVEENGYIHIDLAARNILVGENFICKVGGFGGVVAPNSGNTHEITEDFKIAIKWTAPEVAKNRCFSIKSSVWSFGIVLYELVTYGRFPYPGVPNAQVLKAVAEGYRMPCPIGCPDNLYNIMLDCWRDKSEERPTFDTLQWKLENFHN